MNIDMTHTLIISIGNFIEAYLLIVLMNAFNDEHKPSLYDVLGVILIHGFGMGILNVLFSPGNFLTVIWMVGYWIAAGIYLYGKERPYRYFLITMLFMAIVMVTELLAFFVGFIFGIGMTQAYENISLYLLIFMFTKMVQFFVITNLNYARLKQGMMKQLHMMTVGIIFVLNLVIVLLLFDILRFVDPTNTSIMNETIVLTGIIVVVNVLLYRMVNYLTGYIEREFNDRMNKQYYKTETNHIKALKEQAVNFRSERHDVRNHLGAILALAKSGHPDRIEDYIHDMLEAREETLIYKTDSAIEAIITNKIAVANKLGIHTEVDLKIPSEGQVAEHDVAIIVGNAMDNAIEACKIVESDKFIKVETAISHGYFNIKILNSAIETKKTFGGKFKTTKEDKENHGFGLNNIHSIVTKNNGFMNVKRFQNSFEFKCSMLLGRYNPES